jgi:adenosylcobinamide-GDP ribazoletransferase
MVAKSGSEVAAAVRFLTRLPLPPGSAEPSFGAVAFPVVGLLLGAGALAVDFVVAALAPPLRHVGVVLFWVLATGALHLDGLADTADALGGADREDRLRIMKESTIGVFGVLAIVLAVAARLAALGALHGGRGLVLAPMIGRAAILVSALGAKAARSEGLGASFVAALEPAHVAVAGVFTAAAALVLAGFAGLSACLLAALAAGGVRQIAAERFGGLTGDVLGAAGEIGEIVALAALASLVPVGGLRP